MENPTVSTVMCLLLDVFVTKSVNSNLDGSVSLTFEQVFTGHVPFHDIHNDMAVSLKIIRGERPSRPDVADLDNNMWNSIEDCWKADPKERPTAAQIVQRLFETGTEPRFDDVGWDESFARDLRRSLRSQQVVPSHEQLTELLPKQPNGLLIILFLSNAQTESFAQDRPDSPSSESGSETSSTVRQHHPAGSRQASQKIPFPLGFAAPSTLPKASRCRSQSHDSGTFPLGTRVFYWSTQRGGKPTYGVALGTSRLADVRTTLHYAIVPTTKFN